MSALRGQIIVCDPVPGVDEFTAIEDDVGPELAYVIPRNDFVVLGGTAEPGNESLEPDPRTTVGIIRRCSAMVPALARAGLRIRTSRAGLRPVRPVVRLEEGDRIGTTRVIHNYGACALVCAGVRWRALVSRCPASHARAGVCSRAPAPACRSRRLRLDTLLWLRCGSCRDRRCQQRHQDLTRAVADALML